MLARGARLLSRRTCPNFGARTSPSFSATARQRSEASPLPSTPSVQPAAATEDRRSKVAVEARKSPYLRFGLKPGEAEKLQLGPAMMREVSLSNASRAEVWAVERQRIIEHFARRRGDTGSPEVQVALLTARILSLAAHIREHHKDNHSKRGLMALVNQRKKMVAYMRREGKEKRYIRLKESMPVMPHATRS